MITKRIASRINRNLIFIIVLLLPALTQAKITLTGNEYTIPLADLMIRDEPIMLQGSASDYKVTLPVAKRMKILNAELDLRFVNSISLLNSRSQLAVLLNDTVVAQTPLKGGQPETRLVIKLPVEMLKPGYNTLSFSAAQHYNEKCEDPASKELWTQIDSVKTRLRITAKQHTTELTLAEIPELFDSRQWQTYTLNIVTAQTGATESELKWGTLISQGVALHLDYLPLEVNHNTLQGLAQEDKQEYGDTNFPGLNLNEVASDVVLSGTKKQLSTVLSPKVLDGIEGGFLGVYPHPGASGRAVIVVSGRDEQEVTRAATALAFHTIDLPDKQHVLVNELRVSEPEDYIARRTIQEGNKYRFADLGYSTHTMQGIYPRAQDLNFWVPPDLFVPSETLPFDLHLHLAYGAGFSPLSSLNISLNNEFQRAIHLSEPNGAVYYDYAVSIPMRSLLPGRNTLSFTANMVPSERGGECTPDYTNGLLISLFDDSIIELPDASHFATLPNLRLLSSSAFPMAITRDGSGFAVQITDSDSSIISSAWTLIAKLAQMQGTPFYRLEIGYEPPAREKHLIVVGLTQHLDPEMVDASPFTLGERIHRISSILDSPRPDREPDGFIQSILQLIQSAFSPAQAESTNAHGRLNIAMTGSYKDYAAVSQFESPLHAGMAVTLFTATGYETLQKGINALSKPGMWNSLQGAYAIWHADSESVEAVTTDNVFVLGDKGINQQLAYLFSTYPMTWTISIVLLLLTLAIMLRIALKRYQRRHHGSVSL